MSDYAAEAREPARLAGESPHGPGQVALWESAIAVADTARDEPLGFEFRLDSLWEMSAAGRSDLLLVHYSWCLSYLDRHPEQSTARVLRHHWGVLNYMGHFADIGREQIEAIWRDVFARHQAGGYSTRSPRVVREMVMRFMGDKPEAVAAREESLRCPASADETTYAASSIGRLEVLHQLFLGRDDRALVAAQPFLDGRYPEPHDLIFCTDSMLLALTRAGRATEARALRARSSGLARGRAIYPAESHDALTFLTVTQDFAGAVRHFDRFFTIVAHRPGEFGRIETYKHALFCARQMVAKNRKPQLRVPEGLITGVPGNRVQPGALRDWPEVELPRLCARADARNGNSYYTDGLADLDECAHLARKLA